MFAEQRRGDSPASSAETFIGPSVKLEGNFSGEGDVAIEGILIGNLSTRGDIKVGTNAVIEAEVRAKNANIAGKVKGNLIISNHLKLTSTANISGDLKAMTLSIEEGATVNGKINMSKEKNHKEQSQQESMQPKAKAQ